MIDQFVKQFGNTLEQAASQLSKLPTQEVQLHLQQMAKSTLNKMDLVSREEFEIQSALLEKYRHRIERLEIRLSELEAANTDLKDRT